MNKPTNFTIHEQIEIEKRSASQFSDNVFTKCNIVITNKFVDGFAQSLLNWISFYFLGNAMVFVFLILPFIFFVHASGKQRKMQELYQKICASILNFLVLSCFCVSSTPLLARLIKSESPCVEAIHGTLVPFGSNYQCPSFNVVFAGALGLYLFNVNVKTKSEDEFELHSSIKAKIVAFLNKAFLKILSVLYISFFYYSDIIYGKSSIIQATFSVCYGLFLSFLVEELPILIILIIFALLFIGGIFYLVFTKDPTYFPSVYDDSKRTVYYGFSYIIYTSFLLIRFVIYKKGKKVGSRILQSEDNSGVSSETGEAMFAELDNSEQIEDLKDMLSRDIIDYSIGFAEFAVCLTLIDLHRIIQDFSKK